MFKFGSVPSLLLLAIPAVSMTLTVPGAQGQAPGSLNARLTTCRKGRLPGRAESKDQPTKMFPSLIYSAKQAFDV
jgi:hypothetical protein